MTNTITYGRIRGPIPKGSGTTYGTTDEKKGSDKAPVGERKKKPKKTKAEKCIADAKQATEAWNKCIEDADSWWRRLAVEAQSALDIDLIDTPEEICADDALEECGIKKKGGSGTKKGKQVAKTDDLAALTARQTEQSFLLSNMGTVSETIESEATNGRFPNLMLVSGVEGNLTNIMTSSRKLAPLFVARPLDLSSLMPSIRIFKKHLEARGIFQVGDLEEFRFADAIRIEDITSSKSSVGAGVGLKSFEWKTTGTDPFTAPRTLQATLTLHFQTLSDLIESTTGTSGMKWTDLIIQRGGDLNAPDDGCASEEERIAFMLLTPEEQAEASKTQETGTPKNRDYAIMIEVGYRYPTKNLLSTEFKEAINKSRCLLALTLQSHKFSFRENGTVDLVISYNARYEGLMNTYATDIFNLDAMGQNPILANIKLIENAIAQNQLSIDSPTGWSCAAQEAQSDAAKSAAQLKIKETKEHIKFLKDTIDSGKKKLRVSNYGRFVQFLMGNALLYDVDVSEEEWAEGLLPEVKGAQSAEVGNAIDDAATSGMGNTETDEETSESEFADAISGAVNKIFGKKPVVKGDRRIYYFFLGDLIDFMAHALPNNGRDETQQNTAETFDIVLGDIEYLDFKKIASAVTEMGNPETLTEEQREEFVKSSYTRKNLAYLPISLDLYSMWFTKNVVNGSSVWTFGNFINKLLSELVMGTLKARPAKEIGTGTFRLFNERNKIRRSVVIGTNSTLERGKIIKQPNNVGSNGESMIWIDPQISTEPLTQYLVLSATKLPHSSTEVNEQKNRLEGIHHLRIGTDAGIVKAIDFQRTNKSEIRDWNIMRAYNTGDTSIGAILEPYNATVRLFGSGFFQPGQYVYLNPATMGLGSPLARLSLARKLGIGGFYLINTVQTVAEAGKLETTLDCRFEYYGNIPGEPSTDQAVDNEDGNNEGDEDNISAP